MFDIGAMELFLVAVIALVVVGPKELPKLLRTVGGMVRKARALTAEFRDGVESLAAEAEQEIDPFSDLKKQEGLTPGMSPEDITSHIMSKRDNDTVAEGDAKPAQKADEKKATAKPSVKGSKGKAAP
ncbi:MAG: twin-arginine translocase subunit TatB [Kordiimonadaceae bacterium]|nr:twin-arginine translocase subunit TatB [Kordiimonadaceae bacterium]